MEVAKAALTGGAIVADQTALSAARETLSSTQSTGAAAIDAAQKSVQLTDEATAAAVKVAQDGVTAVQNGVDAIAYKAAQQALENFQQASVATLQTAQHVGLPIRLFDYGF